MDEHVENMYRALLEYGIIDESEFSVNYTAYLKTAAVELPDDITAQSTEKDNELIRSTWQDNAERVELPVLGNYSTNDLRANVIANIRRSRYYIDKLEEQFALLSRIAVL